MPEAANAVNGDEIAGTGARVAQRVEGRDARAGQGRGLDRVESLGHMGDRGHAGDHVRRVAAVAGQAAHLMNVLASEGAVAAAVPAVAA